MRNCCLLCGAVALAVASVSVYGCALSNAQLQGPETLLTDIQNWNTAEPQAQHPSAAAVNSSRAAPPARKPPDATPLQPGKAAAAAAAAALPGTDPTPPAAAPQPGAAAPTRLRGSPSPGLLATIADFAIAQQAADSINSSDDAASTRPAGQAASAGGAAALERGPAVIICSNSTGSICNGSSSNSSLPGMVALTSTRLLDNTSSSSVVDGSGSEGNVSRPGSPPAPLQGSNTVVSQAAAVGVPDSCIIAGSALFSSCATEIYAAQAHFNISVPFLTPQNYTQLLHDRGVTRPQVLQYLQEALASPSDTCCAAQCCFNQLLLCDCEPSVVQVAVRFAGADEAFYALMVAQLARSCGIKHFYGASCPTGVAYPASSAAACQGSAFWPPVHTQPAHAAAAAAAAAHAAAADSQSAQVHAALGVGQGPSPVPDTVVCLAAAREEVGPHAQLGPAEGQDAVVVVAGSHTGGKG